MPSCFTVSRPTRCACPACASLIRLCDIETLNRKAQEGVYDVTAISFHAFPYIQDHYALLPSGGSVGDGYGPMIVATRAFTQSEVKKKKIAVPGKLTTAYLALKLFAPGVEVEVVPFDQIIPQVLEGKYEAGLIIHEGQLTYSKAGLHRVVDLGKWWLKMTGLPLPLGGNAIRRALGPQLMLSVSNALRDSIQYALDHREEALAYAMQFARDLDPQLADKFVGMYVNERTLDYGPDGREAVRRLLDMGHKAGIIPQAARVEFIGEGLPYFTVRLKAKIGSTSTGMSEVFFFNAAFRSSGIAPYF